jgi:hypothetical protein
MTEVLTSPSLAEEGTAGLPLVFYRGDFLKLQAV